MSCQVRNASLVSIVIDNFNYGRFLRQAIDSCLNQTHQRVEVIVVDDGSSDGSRAIIAQYGDMIIPVLKENGGQASAFNAGYAASRGEVVIFLDADDTLHPSAAEKAVKLFQRQDVVKVHWPVWEVDEGGEVTGRIIPGTPLPEGDLRESMAASGPDACVNAPIHGNAFSRSFLEKIFPMPEEFKNHADIYPVSMASIFGVTRRVAEPGGYYRMHGGNHYACQPAEEKNRRNLHVYELRCHYLDKHLRETGDIVEPEKWKQGNSWYQWMRRLDVAAEEIRSVVPRGGSFILVDEEQLGDGWGGSEVIAERLTIPFLERGGQYWGPPPDDASAIRELERLRVGGAGHVVFAWPAFWWLDYYAGFGEYLRSNFDCVLENERVVAFALEPTRPAEANSGARERKEILS